MKLKRKLLNDTGGYTLIELVIVLLIFSIAIVPIYKMVISGAKIQKASEETYEATLQAQSLLQSVKGQIERDVTNAYKAKREGSAVAIKPWLDPDKNATDLNKYLINFLNDITDPTAPVDGSGTGTMAFRSKFKTDAFLYEVHIWHLKDGQLKKRNPTDADPQLPISLFEYDPAVTPTVSDPTFNTTNTSDFTMVDINTAVKNYFGDKEFLLWTNPISATPGATDPKAIGEIIQKGADEISIRGNGIKPAVASVSGSPAITVDKIPGYQNIPEVIELSYERHGGVEKTQNIIINGPALTSDDIVQLSVDLTTFTDSSLQTKVIRIENNTKAKVVIPVYNELHLSNIEIYPIQHKTGGNIVVETRARREPSKNFVIGIIVRDAYNSTFGKPNKVLSKIVDVYSHDYNNQ